MFNFKDIILSSLFFFFYLSLSAWLPFYNLYLKDIGFSGTQIGMVAALFQSSLFFVVPVWGMLSDRKGNRFVLQIALLMTSLVLYGTGYIPTFHLMLVYFFLLAFFHQPLASLCDSLALYYLHGHSRLSYGAFRVWGSPGWAVGTILLGRYLQTHDLKIIFTAGAGLYFITLLITLLFGKSDEYRGIKQDFSVRHIVSVFGEKRIIYFLLLLILCGIGVAPLYVFINLYFRDIGGSNQIIGLAFAVQALCEIPFFFYGRRLVARFGSPKILLFVMFVAVLRLFGYSQIGDPIIAVIVGCAQGITLSLFWVSVTDFMGGLIPKEWRSTGQSLIYAFHLGAGATIGNMSIGRLSDFFPMQQVMLMAGCYSTIVLFVMFLYFSRFKLWRKV